MPQAKLVLIVRNPTKRLYSDYLYFPKEKKSAADFHETVLSVVGDFQKCQNRSMATWYYCLYATISNDDLCRRLKIGLYYPHIQTWLSVFPKQQVHVVRLEKYSEDPVKALSKIFSFLELNELPTNEITAMIESQRSQNANSESYITHGPMWSETKDFLDAFYQPFNLQLDSFMQDGYSYAV